jgi:hypothetical protein
VRGDSGVARGTNYVAHAAFAGQFPRERVLAGAAANDQDPHVLKVNPLPDKGLERSGVKRE